MPGLEDMINKSMFAKGAGKKKKIVIFGKGTYKNIEQAYNKDTSSTNKPKEIWWDDDDDVEFDED